MRSIYNLEELDAQSTDRLLSSPPPSEEATTKPRRTSMSSTYRDDASQTSGPQSPPPGARRPKVAFTGIPRSVVAQAFPVAPNRETSPQPLAPNRQFAPQNVVSSLMNIGSVIFDQTPMSQTTYNASADSVWRTLKRREMAIEEDLQEMLDMQSASLAGGPGDGASMVATEQDNFSDTSSSTPTGTSFYSTVTSRSKLSRSLVQPTHSTSGGDVIPVRQPKRPKPLGIRAARRGLLKAMMALGDLKAEEDARVNAAISQRKTALARLRKVSGRQNKVTTELKLLEEDDDEPLGKELRELEAKRGSLTQEIKELEERLVGLRDKRRWVDDRIHDVRNRREAGLSGYRGALKDVEAEVNAIVRRPPVKPLDREFWRGLGGNEGGEGDLEPGGEEFMSLIPERRTLDMAKTWWEAEIRALEKRRKEVDKNREALERGEEMWRETMDLVNTYESGLAKLTKGHISVPVIAKGKEKDDGQGGIVQHLLSEMGAVTGALEHKLQVAEKNSWNLLICAIGAELDAFKEAERVLRLTLGDNAEPALIPELSMPGDASPNTYREDSTTSMESPVFKPTTTGLGLFRDESDNEVPQDLLASAPEEGHATPTEPSSSKKRLVSTSLLDDMPLERSDSENSVPPEFLVEHPPEEGAGVD
jgi:hypothetical protein